MKAGTNDERHQFDRAVPHMWGAHVLLEWVSSAQMALDVVLHPAARSASCTFSGASHIKHFLEPPAKLNTHTPARSSLPADGSLDVVVRPGRADWHALVADLSIDSPGLCRGLFEVYLGSSSGGWLWLLSVVGCGVHCYVVDPCCPGSHLPVHCCSPPAPTSVVPDTCKE